MKFRPCIDLHNGQVKQIVGSTLKDNSCPQTNFTSSHPPSYYANLYKNDALTGGHVIMLGPGNEEAGCDALAAYPNGLQIGGGITVDNARLWLERGAAAVIVTSWVFREGRILEDRLDKLVQTIGKEHLVLDLSCRKKENKYLIVTDRWQNFTSVAISAETLENLSKYCCEFLIHAVDVEGKCSGIELELAAQLAEDTPIPTTYAGGIRSLDDLRTLREVGKNRLDATIGSALDIFGGSTITYSEAVAFHQGKII